MNNSVEKLVKTLPYQQCYVLSSADPDVRFNGSSGGFVTGLAKYLFGENRIHSAICFHYTGESLFAPTLAFSEKDYVQSGSIYHHVSLVRFLHKNLDKIRSPLFVTCLPCECLAIRKLLHKHEIESVIVSLVCSGQLTKQATYDFLSKHKININKVRSLRYRGRGWPSGMTVEMLDGQKHFFHNVDSDWKCFFHSTIYNLQRCFYCTDTYGVSADFSVADPWFKDYIENEKVGCTVVCASENRFIRLIEQMVTNGQLELHETIEPAELVQSQYWTVAKKESFRKYKFLKLLIRFFRTNFYRKLFLVGNYRYLHYKRYMKLLKRYKKKLYAENNNH